MLHFITGDSKNAFHQFIKDVMDEVNLNLYLWPAVLGLSLEANFRDILANARGRSFGLFHELVSYFSVMDMYFTRKHQRVPGLPTTFHMGNQLLERPVCSK